MAKVLYNGVDVTEDIDIAMLTVTEDCGDTPDTIDLIANSSEDQWVAWEPKKGDMLEITHEGYSSGTMVIDEQKEDCGQIILGAISAPPDRKTQRSQSWENVTLITIANEIAARYSFTAEFYGVEPMSYQRVDQTSKGDFVFLAERCAIEGCKMKLCAGKLVVYSEHTMELAAPVKTIARENFIEPPNFKNNSDIYSSCVLISGGITGVYVDAAVAGGAQLSISGYEASSQGEAERFAKNMLRNKNKRERSGDFSTALDATITAGNTVAISGVGLADGTYFIENARHCFAEEISEFTARKIFERY